MIEQTMADWVIGNWPWLAIAAALAIFLLKIFRWSGKVDSDIAHLQRDLSEMKIDLSGIRAGLVDVRADLSDVKADLSGVKAELSGVKTDLSGVKTDLSGVKAELSGVKTDLSGVKAELSGVKTDLSGVKTDLSGVKTELSGVKDNLARVNTELEKLIPLPALVQQFLDTKATASQSPKTLTPYGKTLAEEMQVEKIISHYADALKAETEAMNPYEIQQHCLDFTWRLADKLKTEHPEDYARMSDVAFDHGELIEVLQRVVGYKLRDKMLEMHNKIPQKTDGHTNPS